MPNQRINADSAARKIESSLQREGRAAGYAQNVERNRFAVVPASAAFFFARCWVRVFVVGVTRSGCSGCIDLRIDSFCGMVLYTCFVSCYPREVEKVSGAFQEPFLRPKRNVYRHCPPIA